MTAMLGRREFLGTAAAAGLLAGCKFSNNESAGAGTGDLAKTLQGIADEMLAEYPQNATILGIATGKLAPLNHQWQDQTPTGVDARRKAIGDRLTRLKAFDLVDLSQPEKLNGAVALQAHGRHQWAGRDARPHHRRSNGGGYGGCQAAGSECDGDAVGEKWYPRVDARLHGRAGRQDDDRNRRLFRPRRQAAAADELL